MNRSLSPLLLVAALTLTIASCGVDGGDDATGLAGDATTTSTTSTTTSTAPEGSEPDAPAPDVPMPDVPIPDDAIKSLAEVYVEFGFTEDEATCLAEQLAGMGGGSVDPSDTGAMMDVMSQCDIPLSRLTEITGELGDGSAEDTMRASLAAGLRASGLTDEQASCVADAFVAEFGADASSAGDPSVLTDLFAGCDVDPGLIGG